MIKVNGYESEIDGLFQKEGIDIDKAKIVKVLLND